MSEDTLPGEGSSPDEANPVRQALDFFVFAPVGLALTVAEDLPGLVSKGRERVESEIRNARVIGKFVVTQGQQDLTPAHRASCFSRSRPRPTPRTPRQRTDRWRRPRWPPHPLPAPKPAPDPADALIVEQALAGYDTLSASQVVRRLESLGPDELRAVQRHEASHRNRRTILNRTTQLLGAGPPEAPEPWRARARPRG